MLFYIFCMATLNLALGFAVALELSRRHSALLRESRTARRHVASPVDMPPPSSKPQPEGPRAPDPQPSPVASEMPDEPEPFDAPATPEAEGAEQMETAEEPQEPEEAEPVDAGEPAETAEGGGSETQLPDELPQQPPAEEDDSTADDAEVDVGVQVPMSEVEPDSARASPGTDESPEETEREAGEVPDLADEGPRRSGEIPDLPALEPRPLSDKPEEEPLPGATLAAASEATRDALKERDPPDEVAEALFDALGVPPDEQGGEPSDAETCDETCDSTEGTERAEAPRKSDDGEGSAAEADAPEEELLPEGSVAETPLASSDTAQPDEKAETSLDLEAALAEWQEQVWSYYEQLSRVRDNLSECQADPELSAIEGCLSGLRTAGEEYVSGSRPARDRFEELSADRSELAEYRENLHAAALDQDACIETAHESFDAFDAEDLGGGCQEIVEHTDRLLQANRKVREALDAAALGMVRARPAAPDGSDPSRHRDPMTGLSNQAGLESGLTQWWEENAEQTRCLSVVVLDVDDFARINEEFGHRVGNEVLSAIAKVLAAETRTTGMSVRLSGKRFACILYNVEMAAAAMSAERLRQTLEQARFHHRKAEIRLTVSCGVTEASTRDTPETLLARAEAGLEQARRYGQNRTFSNDGTFPVPVPPPKIDVGVKHFHL